MTVLTVVTLAAAGCVIFYYFERRCPCPVANLATVKSTMLSDPALNASVVLPAKDVIRIGVGEPALTLQCVWRGQNVKVELTEDPDTLCVRVGWGGGPPNASERQAWIAAVDHICAKLDAALPGQQKWVTEDKTHKKRAGAVEITVVLVLLGLGVWFLYWLLRHEARFRAWMREHRSQPTNPNQA